MWAPSGSGGCKSRYKYAQALSFLRTTMVTQSTVGSTQPAAELNPSRAIPQESSTEGHFDSPGPSAPSHSAPSQPSHPSDPSVTSTNAGASWPVPLHESAGEDIAFPVPYPSSAATSSTPVASGRQRQRGRVQSYAPEFLHLNASFQNCLKVLSEQMAAGFNLINKSILELHTLLLTMRSEASQSPNHTYFRSVLEQMEKLSTDQQMQVMEACQSTLALIASKTATLATPPAPAPLQPLSLTIATTILLTHTSNLPMPRPSNLTITHIVPRPTIQTTTSILPVPRPSIQTTTSILSVPLPSIQTSMNIPPHTSSQHLPRLLSVPTTTSLLPRHVPTLFSIHHRFCLPILPNHQLHPSIILNSKPNSQFPVHPFTCFLHPFTTTY
ncbi:uncharacterized protein [Ranitomeya imitator]|uniref:uncharacterized protein n=1 Tax=Ranitomeya imitator TaxID=111125 RepID=UPI0037E77395